MIFFSRQRAICLYSSHILWLFILWTFSIFFSLQSVRMYKRTNANNIFIILYNFSVYHASFLCDYFTFLFLVAPSLFNRFVNLVSISTYRVRFLIAQTAQLRVLPRFDHNHSRCSYCANFRTANVILEQVLLLLEVVILSTCGCNKRAEEGTGLRDCQTGWFSMSDSSEGLPGSHSFFI